MLANEEIPRNIVVDGADEVVPVAPCVRDFRITFAAVGFREAEEVHPVACPAFAEAGRCEEGFDRAGEGVG